MTPRRKPGRPPGTHPPAVLTVRVIFRISPVTAARLRAQARPGESDGAVARRILVETLAAMDAAKEEG